MDKSTNGNGHMIKRGAVENRVIPLSLLVPHHRNYNRHSDAQIEDLCESLRQFGQVRSIVVRAQKSGKSFVILAGHGVYLAAKKLGWKELRCDVCPASWSETRALAYVAADNELARRGDPDQDQLAAIVREVMESEGEALARLAAGEQKALDALLAQANRKEETTDVGELIDRAAELQKKWQVKRGDIFEIESQTARGKAHRLMCGDSTSAEDVKALMQGERSELLFTSPPYAEMREYGNGTKLSVDYLVQIFSSFRKFTNYFVINLGLAFKNEEINPYWQSWIDAAIAQGLKFLAWNVWDRINATSVRAQLTMFARQHEWIFVFGDAPKDLTRTWEKSEESKKRAAYYRVNAQGQKVTTRRRADGSVKDSVIGETFANKQMGSVFTAYAEMSRSITSHPAMFPVTLPIAYIEATTNAGEYVTDSFLGSGTTLVACEQTGRIGRGMEIEPRYVSVALERMSNLGLEPRRVASAQTKAAANGKRKKDA